MFATPLHSSCSQNSAEILKSYLLVKFGNGFSWDYTAPAREAFVKHGKLTAVCAALCFPSAVLFFFKELWIDWAVTRVFVNSVLGSRGKMYVCDYSCWPIRPFPAKTLMQRFWVHYIIIMYCIIIILLYVFVFVFLLCIILLLLCIVIDFWRHYIMWQSVQNFAWCSKVLYISQFSLMWHYIKGTVAWK